MGTTCPGHLKTLEMTNIQYRLQGFDLPQFNMRMENYGAELETKARTNIEFAYNKDKHVVKSSVYIEMLQGGKEFLVMQMDAYAEIRDSSAERLMTDEGIRLPRNLQCQFASFCYGALRGVMYLKTLNTPLQNIVLPPLELHNIIKSDIVISLD